MRRTFLALSLSASALLFGGETYVHAHKDLPEFAMFGNNYRGLSTKELGAKQYEIWRSSISVGSKTPRHSHETEEVFVLLKGKVRVVIGDQEYTCVAPSTLICPANIPHQLVNIGEEATDQIVVLGIDSKIVDMQGEEINPPWRR